MAIKVTLRQKPIKGNRHSLYLDFYPAIKHPVTGKSTRREFLGMYIYDETVKDVKGRISKIKLNAFDKIHNEDTLKTAKQILLKRENEINKPEVYNDFEKEQLRIKEIGELSFIQYFDHLAQKRKLSNHDNWISTYNHLKNFTGGELKFADLNEKLCNDFRDYLLTTKSIKSAKNKLSHNSAVSYFNKLKASIKQAYKDGYLKYDLNGKVEPIEAQETIKNTLTIEELNHLAKTECDNPLLKACVLFSALTGMPFKEMENLTWGNIESSEAFGIRIKMVRQKTNQPYYLNIGEQALKLLGERKPNNEKVFRGLTNQLRYYDFPLWLAKAGIDKKLTFHDLRHSYGTNQIDAGTDIYTLQGQMGHSDIKHTQIYAKISDDRKRQAAERIKLTLDE